MTRDFIPAWYRSLSLAMVFSIFRSPFWFVSWATIMAEHCVRAVKCRYRLSACSSEQILPKSSRSDRAS